MKKGLLSLILLASLVALPSCKKDKSKKTNGKKMYKRGEKKAKQMNGTKKMNGKKMNNARSRRYSEAEGKKAKEALVA